MKPSYQCTAHESSICLNLQPPDKYCHDQCIEQQIWYQLLSLLFLLISYQYSQGIKKIIATMYTPGMK